MKVKTSGKARKSRRSHILIKAGAGKSLSICNLASDACAQPEEGAIQPKRSYSHVSALKSVFVCYFSLLFSGGAREGTRSSDNVTGLGKGYGMACALLLPSSCREEIHSSTSNFIPPTPFHACPPPQPSLGG